MAMVPEDERLRIVELYTKEYSQRAVAAMLSEIRQCFQLTASKTTVKRRLAEAGLKSRMAAQKPLLTNVNKSKRLSFAQRHEAWSADDWGRVVFSDECTFTTKWDQRARVWRPDRTRFRPEFVQRVAASGRTVVSVWGCITRDGLGPLVRIQGALTADKYSNLLDTEWEGLKCDSSFTEALYRSLPERMKDVVDAEGDVTRY
ncbi:hypothetical protein HPB49_003986 [Dermacentor silvarum]|uniref:Uncharacterized protein n=1 Tax=Dermacentor silvarum TaxID=543639 RepID=A0ACB8DU28_DERSI|nr:hypothetical protein HPB49_003986 [Dermacentor silvarum]